jgi:prepilin-type N-terminal cleavage/methylation domain-containing protein
MQQFHIKRKDALRGLTLVEMIVVVALFTILMLAITESIASFYRFNGYTLAQSYQVTNARKGIEQMVRDLREMTYADDGTFPLASMDEYQVTFYSDVDRDASVEYLEYKLSSTTLTRNIYKATGTPPTYNTSGEPTTSFVVSEYVQNELQNVPVFVYYDGQGHPATATSTVTDIQYIQVNTTVNIDPIRDPGQYMLRSSASLRNLKK